MSIIYFAVLLFFVFNIIMGLASVCTWVERKGSALIQDRIGANRAGAYVTVENFSSIIPIELPAFLRFPLRPVFVVVRFLGMLGVINTLLCDAVKALFKEDFVPEGQSTFIHALGPYMAVMPVFVSFALVPLAPDFEIMGQVVRPQLASLDAGILFIFAMGSLSVYGVAFAGYVGNNKFSLLGGLRAAAQMISYELAMGVTLVTVILMYGTLDLYQMVEAQKGLWGVVANPLAFIVLFVVGMAETKRGPFDLPESESELVAGYFTEYSGMKFLLFWLGEFAEIALFSILLSLLFFGGWHIPFVRFPEHVWWAALIGHVVLMTKVMFFAVLQIVIRWTLPRFRYDQLMNLGWKILLPVSIVNLLVTAVVKLWV